MRNRHLWFDLVSPSRSVSELARLDGALAYHITQLNPADTGTMEELTFTYMALVSFINVSLLTLIGWLVWRSSRRLAIGFRKPR